MKLKNIGTKVISVGKVVILPNEVGVIDAKGYENNPAVNFLIQTKRLEVVKEKAEKKASANEAKKPAKENKPEPPATTSSPEQE